MNTLNDNMLGERMLKFSLDLICTVDRNGHLLFVNEACRRIMGYESEELINARFVDFIHPTDCGSILEAGTEAMKNKATYCESRCLHRSGKVVPVIWSVVWSEEDEAFFCIGRDATERKFVRQGLNEKDERFHTLVDHGSDILILLDEELNFLYSGNGTLKELGYRPEQLIGANALSFIHPKDVPLIKGLLSEGFVNREKIRIPKFRFKNAKGEWRWLEMTGNNQLDNPSIRAWVTSSRDITEHINSGLRLQENQQHFVALFDGNPDMVFFENKAGIIEDANPAVVSFFGIEKQEILNRPLSDFLPLETALVWADFLQEAISGNQVNFDLKVSLKSFDLGQRVFNIKKIPVEVNHEIIGVYTVAKDITAMAESHRKIKQQAKKLNTVFESITDAFFTLDQNWHFTYINSEFDRLLGTDRKNLIGRNVWEVFPEGLNGELYRQFQSAVETGRAVHFKFYVKKLDRWLEEKAFPSEEGLSVYFSDVTDSVKSEQELEKLSLVASKTTNGVVITGADGLTEWVNEGFTNLTGYTASEVIGRRPNYLLQKGVSDKASIQVIREKRKQGKPFTEEMLVYTKTGKKIWLLVDITPVLDEHGNTTRFVAIQTDITERKEAEVNQLQMTNDLFRQNRDLQQFTYIVSHNLRSPVASIMGLAEILTTTDKSSETYGVSLGYLKRTAGQLDTVLKDLNMILSIRDKNNATGSEKVELAPVCQQVTAALDEQLKSCGGDVLINIGEGISVNGNRAYLYSIFYNLLSNAIKYRSPDRSLEVNIKCCESPDRGIKISFSDNGLGFDMEKAGENIFKLYKRFHLNAEGRGIGLFLVKAHVEAMDGEIEVKSKTNAGTTFFISLNRTE
jgi:PAS domain S-box-containing protein